MERLQVSPFLGQPPPETSAHQAVAGLCTFPPSSPTRDPSSPSLSDSYTGRVDFSPHALHFKKTMATDDGIYLCQVTANDGSQAGEAKVTLVVQGRWSQGGVREGEGGRSE